MKRFAFAAVAVFGLALLAPLTVDARGCHGGGRHHGAGACCGGGGGFSYSYSYGGGGCSSCCAPSTGIVSSSGGCSMCSQLAGGTQLAAAPLASTGGWYVSSCGRYLVQIPAGYAVPPGYQPSQQQGALATQAPPATRGTGAVLDPATTPPIRNQ